MSKATHTPGPWHAILERESWWVRGFGGWLSISLIGRAEARENAHLIAAAPDLLEACEQVISDWNSNEDWNGNLRGTIDKLVAAVAKAKCLSRAEARETIKVKER